jgi:aldehyde dehydrogenase (NAD+)
VIDRILAAGTGDDITDVQNRVGGAWRTAADGTWIEVGDPAHGGAPFARVPAMSPADVTEAWDAAEAAAEVWREMPPTARGAILARAAALIRELRVPIARVLTREMGKTLGEAAGEVSRAADFFDYYAGLAREPTGEILADARPGVSAWTSEEPVGLVLAITPWNDPLATPARKLAPALIAGNAVVLKPASETPVSASILAAILDQAGLPGGALNTVTGRVSVIGDALLEDRRAGAVTFTGSTKVGLTLQRRLAGGTVRIETEMGGKNAAVVFADADLPLAARTIADAAFNQTGQRCTATSRVIVHQAVRDPLVKLLSEAAAALRIGPGLDSATTMGPLVSQAQRASVQRCVEAARAQGAQVLYADETGEAIGPCFVSPTILQVSRSMDIWRQEVFGPVVTVLPVGSFDEAAEAANDSDYGLSAAVYTRDLANAHRFIARVQAGQVAVNLPTSGWDVHQPFGGWKRSGSAFKEHGKHGLRFYTRVKTVALGLGAAPAAELPAAGRRSSAPAVVRDSRFPDEVTAS